MDRTEGTLLRRGCGGQADRTTKILTGSSLFFPLDFGNNLNLVFVRQSETTILPLETYILNSLPASKLSEGANSL